jgi:hypothetical protein
MAPLPADACTRRGTKLPAAWIGAVVSLCRRMSGAPGRARGRQAAAFIVDIPVPGPAVSAALTFADTFLSSIILRISDTFLASLYTPVSVTYILICSR